MLKCQLLTFMMNVMLICVEHIVFFMQTNVGILKFMSMITNDKIICEHDKFHAQLS